MSSPTAWLALVDAAAFAITAAAVVRRHVTRAAAPAMAASPVRAIFIDCDDCLCKHATAKPCMFFARAHKPNPNPTLALTLTLTLTLTPRELIQGTRRPEAQAQTHTATAHVRLAHTADQNEWSTANKITKSIAAYTAKLGVSKDQAYNLYKTHGTCLKGLLVEGRIDERGVEQYLKEVHEINYDDIAPDPLLRDVLSGLPWDNTWVFTASTTEHAQRCLARVGIDGLPWRGVIDCRSCALETKHSRSSFESAMRIAGVSDPAACVFFDDSVKNIVAAKEVGWRTVLVGKKDRDSGKPIVCAAADVHVASLHELKGAMPELFVR